MLKLGVHTSLKRKTLYKVEWKPIEGYEGLYEISNNGKVRGLDRKDNKGRKVKGQIIKIHINTHGYQIVDLCKDGERKHYQLHRLIAKTFIPNPDNKPHIDHINTIKSDNRIKNLRWVTRSENMLNELTRKHNSERQIGRKLTEEHKKKVKENTPLKKSTLCIETNKVYFSAREAGRQTGICYASIIACCNGKVKSAGGYRWKYVKSN